ncbi:MAG: hypothetical protein AAFX81_03030 [Pseudomonadota bacterium]
MRERRQYPRYVVEGLDVFVDGMSVHTLDVSAVAVRIVAPDRTPARRSVRLRFESHPDMPALTADVDGQLLRATQLEAVYAYVAPAADWGERLADYDTFRQLHIAELED